MSRSVDPLRQSTLPALLLVGDAVATFGALSLAYWLRYNSPVGSLGLDVPDATYARYLPLLLLGVGFLLAAFAHLGLYDSRLLLRKQQSLSTLARGTFFWLGAYLAFSLVAKIDPPISRLFVLVASLLVLLILGAWREGFYYILTHSALLPRVQRRVAVLGWNRDAATLVAELADKPAHPYQVAGCILPPGTPAPDGPIRVLGASADLEAVLVREHIDVLIAASLDLPRDELERLTRICEQTYVEWKVVPTSFQIFLSGLTLQSVGSVPVLGVEDLAINRLLNRFAKRLLDVAGALFGLLASAPVVAVLALLIKRESPGGPVFFRQVRIGAGHRPFILYKLRSMTPDAADRDHEQVSTRPGDARLLKIGAFLRRWNLDELPQLWNVLRGDMSLVGPRPERPLHVDQLSVSIPHYLPRHLVRPGMTGWAQVNGLRGEGDLEKRVSYDIYYIENWSFGLDVQILLLTFVRWRSPT